MPKQPKIYYLSYEDVTNDNILQNNIYPNMSNNYYWSDDWSEEFYIALAYSGFISTTYDTKEGLVLLPEMQFDYALLDFEDLHISKKVKKLLNQNSYTFSLNERFDELLEKLDSYHKYNWVKGKYITLLKKLMVYKGKGIDFQLISVELGCKQSKELIAGELGYIIGSTYTSLSGFSSKQKEYNNYGGLQLVLLARYLEKEGFAFWNMGHTHMQYKQKLGAKIYCRKDFLKRWIGARDKKLITTNKLHVNLNLDII